MAPSDAGVDAVLRSWLSDYLAFYRRNGVVIRAWMENQMADRELARLGTKSFERIAKTVYSSMSASGSTNVKGPGVELRATAMLALIERFAYIVTSRDLGWTDDEVLDTLATLVHRGLFMPRPTADGRPRPRSPPELQAAGLEAEESLATASPIWAGSHFCSVALHGVPTEGPMCHGR